MKKISYILLSLPLLFSNCQQESPSPSSSPLPPACCTFSEPSLNYNPVWEIQGVTNISCDTATIFTKSNGAITNVTATFTSYCAPSTTIEMDWMMNISLTDQTITTSPLQESVIYNMTGNLSTEDPLIQCTFSDYNCSLNPNIYRNTDITSGQMNGTMIFDIDWTVNTLSGSFSFILQDVSTGTNKSISNCTFSDLAFTHQIVNI